MVYGSIDTGKTVVSNDKYHELLDQAAKELKMLPHEVGGLGFHDWVIGASYRHILI